jgi:hypothetical protein
MEMVEHPRRVDHICQMMTVKVRLQVPPAILVYPKACGMFIAASVDPAMTSCKASAGLSRRALLKGLSNHDSRKTKQPQVWSVHFSSRDDYCATPLSMFRLEAVNDGWVSVKRLYHLRPKRSGAVTEHSAFLYF